MVQRAQHLTRFSKTTSQQVHDQKELHVNFEINDRQWEKASLLNFSKSRYQRAIKSTLEN